MAETQLRRIQSLYLDLISQALYILSTGWPAQGQQIICQLNVFRNSASSEWLMKNHEKGGWQVFKHRSRLWTWKLAHVMCREKPQLFHMIAFFVLFKLVSFLKTHIQMLPPPPLTRCPSHNCCYYVQAILCIISIVIQQQLLDAAGQKVRIGLFGYLLPELLFFCCLK